MARKSSKSSKSKQLPVGKIVLGAVVLGGCLLYTSPSPRD